MVLLAALAISLVQLGLFTACGLGLTMLLLAEPLRSHQLTLAPVFGLALLAVLGFYGTVAGLTLRMVLPLALALAALALALALRRPELRRPGLLPLRELGPLGLIGLGAWLLALYPVIAFGRLMPIGFGMDVEFYMGLAEYLKDFSYVSLPQAPVGPLRELLTNDHIGVIAFGASYAQGMADLLAGWSAWVSWVPMQATLRVLALLSLYALLRGTLAVPVPGALLGVLFAGLNSLLLWLSYNNFSASLAGLVVLPAALAVTLPALERGPRGQVLAGALLIGGLTCLYWPLLTAFGLLGGALGVAALWSAERRGAVVRHGLLLLALGALVGLLPNLRAPRAFPGLFAATTAFLGIDFFPPAPIFAGTLRFTHLEPTGPEPAELIFAWVACAAAAVLLGLGIWVGTGRRAAAVTLGAASLLYLGGLRVVVGYPYGYFRGGSYVAPMFLGFTGAGLAALVAMVGNANRRRVLIVAAALPGLIVGSALLVASVGVARSYAVAPRGYTLANSDLNILPDLLERPGPVLFSSAAATALCGNSQGAWAFWLREHELVGHVRSTFASSVNPRTSAPLAYGLLLRGEDPAAHGLRPGPLWQDDLVSLYAAPDATIAWLTGLDRYTVAPACAGDSSNFVRAGLGLGDYAAATPGRPLTLAVTPDSLALTGMPAAAVPATRSLELELASFVTQTVRLDLGGETRQVTLPVGLNVYRSGPLPTPLTLTLGAESAPVLLRSARLMPAAAPTGFIPAGEALLLGVQTTVVNQGLELDLQVRNQSPAAFRLALEIYAEVYGYGEAPKRYGGGVFALPPDGLHELRVDLLAPGAMLDGNAVPLSTAAMDDGRYFAALWVYQGEQIRRTIPVAAFERRNGQLARLEPLSTNLVVVPPAAPAVGSAVRVGEAIGLAGYELSATQARPGERLRVSFLWEARAPMAQPYLLFVQILDQDATKLGQWDGAVGGDWLPTSAWQTGQRIWQDVPLDLAPDAPPGSYRVVAGIYDPATGARLPLSSGGDMLTLAELVVAP